MESVQWQQFASQQKKRKLEKIDWKNKKLVFTEVVHYLSVKNGKVTLTSNPNL